MPSPLSWLIAASIAIFGAIAVFGASPPIPPAPKAVLHAKTSVKPATAQMAGAKASFIGALPRYVQVQFDVDPHNGAEGYLNLITYLQGSTNFVTWTNLGSTWGQTNGFAVKVTNQYQFLRLMTPMWTAK